jgi:S1-C subfamily serine protease
MTHSGMFRSGIAVALTVAVQQLYAQGGPCPENRPRAGTIGIERFECVGRSCNVGTRADDGSYFHSFSVEPRVGAVNKALEPARLLQVGDVILAIDGVPITTSEGGRRIANLEVGETVSLLLRRDGDETEVKLVPVLGCNTPGLRVRIP